MRILPSVVFALANCNSDSNVGAFQFLSRRTPKTPLTTRLYNTPSLDNWKMMPEGKIRGVISGHPVIPDGDTITTSPLLDPEAVSGDELVQTNTGSQYKLLRPQGTQVIQKVRGTRTIQGTQKIGHKPAVTIYPGQNMGPAAVAVPVLGGVLVALGSTVGFNEVGDKLSYVAKNANIQALNQLAGTSSKTPFFAQPFEYKVELPYLAEKVSEAEKQIQSAERNFLVQQLANVKKVATEKIDAEQTDVIEQNDKMDVETAERAAEEAALATKKAAAEKAAVAAEKAVAEAEAKLEQAEAVASEKLALEKTALVEKEAWDKIVAEKTLAEKAEEEELIVDEMMVVKAQAEQKLDEAIAAEAKVENSKKILEELEAERVSALLAEETAAAQEQIAEQEMTSAMDNVKETAENLKSVASSLGISIANKAVAGKDTVKNNALMNLFDGPDLGTLFKTNPVGATASLVTAGVAVLGTLLRYREDMLADSDSKPSNTPSTALSTSASIPEKTVKKAVAQKVVPPPKTDIPPPPPVPKASEPPQPVVIVSQVDTPASGSYLDSLAGSAPSDLKQTSYFPFGNFKETASSSSSSNSLYSPAAASPDLVISTSKSPPVVVESSPIIDVAQTTETLLLDSPPPVTVTKTAYGSYLENISAPSDSVKPSSYSPFRNGFSLSSSSLSDSLYAAAATSAEVDVVSSDPIDSTTGSSSPIVEAPPAAYDSYLEILSGSGSASIKASSYSPFKSTPLGGSSSNDSLYSPPTTPSFEPDEVLGSTVPESNGKSNSVHTPYEESNGVSYLEALSGAAPSSGKASYSPFGSIKLAEASSSSSMLYSPPAPTANGSSEEAKIVVEDRIRTAYNEWCQYYGKSSKDHRLEIFAMNYASAEEYFKTSGAALMLNEHADLTEGEYHALANSQ